MHTHKLLLSFSLLIGLQSFAQHHDEKADSYSDKKNEINDQVLSSISGNLTMGDAYLEKSNESDGKEKSELERKGFERYGKALKSVEIYEILHSTFPKGQEKTLAPIYLSLARYVKKHSLGDNFGNLGMSSTQMATKAKKLNPDLSDEVTAFLEEK